jgi:hypothetical protein
MRFSYLLSRRRLTKRCGPTATEWERIGNQIDAGMIFARADFVKVRRTLRVAGACEFKYLVAWSG